MYFAPPKAARSEGKPRRLWLHAGLHKTGTTSLQSFLTQKRDLLAEHGLLYVRAGTNQYLNGNHNVAWELTGDRRFELDTGTVAEAVQEIADFPGDAILSSEDFEGLLHQPKGFDPLLRHPLLRNHQVTVLIYIRNQAEYLASVFRENRDYHGIDWSVSEYLDRVLKDGRIPVRDWIFQFDLKAVAKAWPHHGAKLALRNYHTLADGSSVNDFLSLVAPDIEPGEYPRLNVAPTRMRLRDTDAATLMERFGPDNLKLCKAMGIAADGLTEVPSWSRMAVEIA